MATSNRIKKCGPLFEQEKQIVIFLIKPPNEHDSTLAIRKTTLSCVILVIFFLSIKSDVLFEENIGVLYLIY